MNHPYCDLSAQLPESVLNAEIGGCVICCPRKSAFLEFCSNLPRILCVRDFMLQGHLHRPHYVYWKQHAAQSWRLIWRHNREFGQKLADVTVSERKTVQIRQICQVIRYQQPCTALRAHV